MNARHEKKLFYYFAFLGGLAVILGAFGAHTLKTLLAPEQLLVYKTGVQYHFYHLILLGVLAILYKQKPSKSLMIPFNLTLLGILLFSGSLYLLSCRYILGIESWTWLGPITPIGGLCFLAAWFSLACHVYKS